MKTVEEIFNWLVRNCKYHETEYTEREIKDLCADEDYITLLAYTEYIPAFHADLGEFEKFIGENYSFSKHLKPVVDAGLIYCIDPTSEGFYSSDEHKKAFDKSTGLVRDYDAYKSYVRFWLGAKDPNES